MSSIEYIEPEDLVEIIDVIRGFDYVHHEEVPHYDDEQGGIDDYFSLVDRIKNDTYYPTLLSKATALFLQLNTTHFFSNGNKRIAAFSLVAFLNKNGVFENGFDKEGYQQIFEEVFPIFEINDFATFSATDFLLYNLAMNTARFNEFGIDFNQGKEIVESFLRRSFS